MSAPGAAPGVSAPGAPRAVTPLGMLTERLDDLVARAGATGADPQLRAGLASARDLAAGLDPYLAACSSGESPGLAALAARTAQHDWRAHAGERALEQEMLSGHVEGRFLAMIVAATGARRILDIGLFTGYSALAMAEAAGPHGRVTACEVDADVAAFARESLDAAPGGERVEVLVGPAADTLAGLADAGAAFDLVFVDADKGGYSGYLAALLGDTGRPALLAPGGLVLVDNTLLQGEPWAAAAQRGRTGDAIARFNAAVAADPRLDQVVVPLRDGITLLRRATDPPPRRDGPDPGDRP